MTGAGRVITGYSKPYVAKYDNAEGSVTYSEVQQLARGVSITIEPEVSEETSFYADNVEAESSGGTFIGGTLTATVDGLKAEAESFIMGLPEPEKKTIDDSQVDIYKYNDQQKIPYVGFGCIVRYQSRGVISYEPLVLAKVKFQTITTEAATQEDTVEYQTSELTAEIKKDDTPEHNWKLRGAEQASEEAAEKILVALLGGAVMQSSAEASAEPSTGGKA